MDRRQGNASKPAWTPRGTRVRRSQSPQECEVPVFEGECDMRGPPVSERIKEVPAQALRGVFAGIGQLLLITDRLRNKTPADAGVPRARTRERSERVADATLGEPAVPQEKATEPAPAPPTGA